MIERRCPWCGIKISDSKKLKTYRGPITARGVFYCNYCKHTVIPSHSIKITLLVGCALIWTVSQFGYNITTFIFILIYSILLEYILKLVPLRKYYDTKYNMELLNINKVKIQINWEKHKQSRLFMVKFRVWNYSVFPICFVNAEGIAVSQMWCVILTKINRLTKRSKATLEYVCNDAPLIFLKEGQRFYIFKKEKKIGEGVIVKK